MVIWQVYKGQWKGRTVAVKICRAQNLTTKAMKQFQTEVAILNSCSHENVVEFIGACCWKVPFSPMSSIVVIPICNTDLKLNIGAIGKAPSYEMCHYSLPDMLCQVS